MKATILSRREGAAALEWLSQAPALNLFLIELASRLGESAQPNESAPYLVAAWRGREIAGIASLRPSVALDASMDDDALDALLPHLLAVEAGLVKSPTHLVGRLWEQLQKRGRRALIDRNETGYALSREDAKEIATRYPPQARIAEESDLDDLVTAARASLREENRPDPCDGDPVGFRRWVKGRLPRARVIDVDGRLAFVGYADVRRREGWLVQGVYTWRRYRGQGYGSRGMASIIEEAFASASTHVQLAVVDGNEPAIRLYEGLGFQPFCRLRTVLFQ